MNSIDFYKELYFREIDRKYQLNNDINIPILLLSAIVTIQTFLYSQKIDVKIFTICVIISSVSSLFGIHSLYFLFMSFSNSFKTHKYKEIANAKSYYDYEIDLINQNPEIATFEFDKYLTQELAECSAHNFEINRKRTENLAQAKKSIFFAVIFSLLLYIIFSISIIINMSDEKPKETTSTEKTTAEAQPKGPQSVYIKNSKEVPNRKDGK
jgi:amino acid permease